MDLAVGESGIGMGHGHRHWAWHLDRAWAWHLDGAWHGAWHWTSPYTESFPTVNVIKADGTVVKYDSEARTVDAFNDFVKETLAAVEA